MRVHNLVQDLIIQKVEEMFIREDQLKGYNLENDELAKMDVVCYVLNRTQPQYVVSGRGVAYNETSDYQKKLQLLADITRLIGEGIQSVALNRRTRPRPAQAESASGRYFNFPSIIGRLFNGVNFEPVTGVKVYLSSGGKSVKVIDPNWQNPYELVPNTAGTFLFWPHPIAAEALDTEKQFFFEIRVDHALWEPLNYHFEIISKAENDFVDFVNTTTSFRIKDLYLFPKSEDKEEQS